MSILLIFLTFITIMADFKPADEVVAPHAVDFPIPEAVALVPAVEAEAPGSATLAGGGGMVMPLSHIAGIADAVGGEDEVVAANEDRGNCSCLEGNPCVEKYCCKDWKNRFKIAKAVRKMKGMESLPGD